MRFSDAVGEIAAPAHTILLEVGAGSTLGVLVRQRLEPGPEVDYLHPVLLQGPAKGERRLVLSSILGRVDPRIEKQLRRHARDTGFAAHTLGSLWCHGVEIDWDAVRSPEPCRRISLPTYPFQRERFWIERAGSAAPVRTAPSKRLPFSEWFHTTLWKQTVAPPVTHTRHQWLLFEDDTGLAGALQQRLGDVLSVRAGPAFEKLGERTWTVRPGEREDLDELFAELREAGDMPDRIAHLWGVVETGRASTSLASLDEYRDRGFDALLALTQALAEHAEPIRITAVTNDLFEVTGEPAARIERATLLGPAMVAPMELPHLTWRHVDVHLAADSEQRDRAIDHLANELVANSREAMVALRHGHRWMQQVERIAAPPIDPMSWIDGGVFLVTGGLGGIGRTLALNLAKRPGTRLILLSRSERPTDGPRLAALRELEELEQFGGQVMLAQADVSDLEAMRTVVAEATQRFGQIDGVIHAAGLNTGGIMALRSRAEAAEVLDPKVRGTLVLLELLRDQPLRFFALCSSLNGIQGAVGAADYCGANAFLDALVRSTPDVPLVSIAWDAWREVGMAAETDVGAALQRDRERALELGLTNEEGAKVFDLVCSGGLRHVLISTHDLEARLREQPAVERQTSPREIAHRRPELETDYVAPQTETETLMAAIVQELPRHPAGGHPGQPVRPRLRFAARPPAGHAAQAAAQDRGAIGSRVQDTHRRRARELRRPRQLGRRVQPPGQSPQVAPATPRGMLAHCSSLGSPRDSRARRQSVTLRRLGRGLAKGGDP